MISEVLLASAQQSPHRPAKLAYKDILRLKELLSLLQLVVNLPVFVLFANITRRRFQIVPDLRPKKNNVTKNCIPYE